MVFDLGMEKHLSGEGLYYKGVPNKTYKQKSPPMVVTYNSRGYRNKEFNESKTAIRIGCLGGSSTWGGGVNADETWPAFLQRYLDKDSPGKYEVINAGFGSYNAKMVLNLIENEFIKYAPDMIIIYAGYNEHTGGGGQTLSIFSNSSNVKIFLYNVHNFLTAKSVFYTGLTRFCAKGDPTDIIKIGERMRTTYRKNLDEIIKICRAKNVKLVILKQPLYLISPNPSSAGPGDMFLKYYKSPYFEEATFRTIQKDARDRAFYARYGRTYYYQYLIFNEIDKIKSDNSDTIVIGSPNLFIYKQETGGNFFQDVVHLTPQGNDLLAGEIFRNPDLQSALSEIKGGH